MRKHLGPFDLKNYINNGTIEVAPAGNVTSIYRWKEAGNIQTRKKEFNYYGQIDSYPSATGVGQLIWSTGMYEG